MTPPRRVTVLVAMLAAAGCATRSADVFPEVAAVGDEVRVAFGARHPWVERGWIREGVLEATYDDGRGQATQRLAQASLGAQQAMVFRLPDVLTVAPRSAVCLRVSVTLPNRGATYVPIRARSPGTDDTAGFAHPTWSARAAAVTAQTDAQKKQAAQDDGRRRLERAIVNRRNFMMQVWAGTTAAHCEKVESVLGRLPSDPEEQALLVEPGRQSREAHRACTARVRSASDRWAQRVDEATKAADPADNLRALIAPDEQRAARPGEGDRGGARADLDATRSLWALPMHLEWIARGRSPVGALHPAFLEMRKRQANHVRAQLVDYGKQRDGRYADSKGAPIPLHATAAAIQTRWIVQKQAGEVGAVVTPEMLRRLEMDAPLTITDLQGWIGAGLDAFDECVQDVGSQFKAAWDAAERRKDAPVNTAELRRMCRGHVEQLATLEDTLANLPAAPVAAAPSPPVSADPLPRVTSGRLNDNVCH